MISGFREDFRYAARGLMHTPLFALVVVLSLSLGIGGVTALYSVVDARYLRKLPVENPDELVAFRWAQFVRSPQLGDSVGVIQRTSVSRITFDALGAGNETLSELLAYTNPTGAAAAIDSEPEAVSVQLVSGRFFPALGIAPAAGRLLGAADDEPGAAPAVVISERFWARRFSRERTAIGRNIVVGGVAATIVGVVAPEFRGLSERGLADVIVPLVFEAPILGNADPSAATLQIMGRAKPGVTEEQIRGNLEGVFRDTMQMTLPPGANAAEPPRLEVVSASRGETMYVGGTFQRFIFILAAVLGLLLLIVSLNVANMLLARAATRDHELGVRLAMGASRARLIRQLLAESTLVAVLGGVASVLVAYWSKDLLALVLARDLDLRIDLRVLGFMAAISVSTGILVGLVPALQATSPEMRALVQAGRRNTRGARSALNRTSLIAQVAMSVVLMIGAGLLLRTLGKLPHDDPGFAADNLLIFRVNPPTARYDDERARLLYEQILGRVAAIPGVAGATYSSAPLVSTYNQWGNILAPGDRAAQLESSVTVRELGVHPSFFSVTGLTIRRGRAFEAADRAGEPVAAVVSERVARTLFGGTDPIGRRARLFTADSLEIDIVGVVPDVDIGTLGDDTGGTVFWSSAQVREIGHSMNAVSFSIRVRGDPAALVPALHDAVRGLDADLPLFGVTTQRQLLEERLAGVYRITLTWTLLGALALVLTSIGLYGLMSYTTARRTSEIGVRMALGARPRHVIRLVMGQTLRLVGIGIAIGAAASLLVSQTIRVFVFGVTLYDPVTIVGVVLAILGVTAVAGYLPARRASVIDPSASLRCD